MTKPLHVNELMQLISRANGWSSQCSTVSIGYMAAQDRDGFGDRVIDDSNWGYVVETTICGTNSLKVHAQGKTLEEALERLLKAIPTAIKVQRDHYDKLLTEANSTIHLLHAR